MCTDLSVGVEDVCSLSSAGSVTEDGSDLLWRLDLSGLFARSATGGEGNVRLRVLPHGCNLTAASVAEDGSALACLTLPT